MTRTEPLFIIGKKQARAMSGLVANEFVVRCREFLRSNYPATASAPDEELDRMTRDAIDLGESLRLRNEISVQRLLALRQDHGFTKETELPAALRELISSPAAEGVRLDLLEDHLDPGEADEEE